MKMLRFAMVMVFLTGCGAVVESAGPSPDAVQSEATAHEALLTQALRELSTLAGDERVLALRAQLETDLAESRKSRPLSSNTELGSTAQALTAGDGCSTPEWANILLEVTFLHDKGVFHDQCVWHDQCYYSGKGTYELSRDNCDAIWLGKMTDRCASRYPLWARVLSPSVLTLWLNCKNTASTMYAAVRAKAGAYFENTACIGGQIWPTQGNNGPGCSSYEPFDSSRAATCSGVSSGLRADATVGPNWNGCRGSGCWGCADALTTYPKYFTNHPLCVRNTTCAGSFFQCGSACPAPSNADR